MLNDKGQEIPDDTPIVIHIKNRRIAKFDDVRAFIRAELSNAARMAGEETFEEANDFDIDGDPIDPSTPYEYSADQELADLETLRDYPKRSAPEPSPPPAQDALEPGPANPTAQ